MVRVKQPQKANTTMRPLISVAAVFAVLAVTGCDRQETYPVSGEECGPTDPVRTLDASDCKPV
jgi:hypothetical protein